MQIWAIKYLFYSDGQDMQDEWKEYKSADHCVERIHPLTHVLIFR